MRVGLKVVEFFVDGILFEVANVFPPLRSDTFALGNARMIEPVLAEEFVSPRSEFASADRGDG